SLVSKRPFFTVRYFCKGPSDSVNDASVESATQSDQKEDKKAKAQKKLANLLLSLATADPIPAEPTKKLDLAAPSKAKIDDAVKAMKEKKKEEIKVDRPSPVDEADLKTATRDVAESLGGDVSATESELLSTLRMHMADDNTSQTPNLSELFVGLKVERSQPKESSSLGEQDFRMRRDNEERKINYFTYASINILIFIILIYRDYKPRDLFSAEPLDIFPKNYVAPKKDKSFTPTWDALADREMSLSVSHPPENAIEEMIQWTKQGKLWKFPINNEIGLEEEKKVGFHEHIFLERNLAGWCPQRGPVRHFMELVCTGLSKNPHLTVERKKEHIIWYKNYFGEKEAILKEVGAV
ncbi:unnamed protein product, partial [Meganyctiphanes norvegica]